MTALISTYITLAIIGLINALYLMWAHYKKTIILPIKPKM